MVPIIWVGGDSGVFDGRGVEAGSKVLVLTGDGETIDVGEASVIVAAWVPQLERRNSIKYRNINLYLLEIFMKFRLKCKGLVGPHPHFV